MTQTNEFSPLARHFADNQNGEGEGVGENTHDNHSVASSASDSSVTTSHASSRGLDTGNKSGKKDDDDDKKLVHRETIAVWRSKMLVFSVITFVAVAGSTATFFLVRRNEESDFGLTFLSFAKEIGESSSSKVVKSFSVVGMLSKSISSLAMNDNQTWPFFTHNNFDEVAGEARRISEVDAIALAPLVHLTQQQAWEDYTKNHSQWLQQGLEYRGLPDVNPGPIPTVHFFAGDPHLHGPGETHFGNYVLPLWQIADAPTNASIINLDLFSRSTFEHAAVDVLEGRKAILSDARADNMIAQYSINSSHDGNDAANLHQYGSYLMQPVYDRFREVNLPGATDPELVAFLIAVFPWSTYFNNILPIEVEGIVVVIADRCGAIFTYVINGHLSQFVGTGDLHDPKYDDFRFDVDFADFAKYQGPPHTPFNGTSYDQRFKGTDKAHCDYLLSMYPSSTFSTMQRENAAIYSVGVAVIFGCILGLLMLYDFMVTRRQNKLMATARKTDAIVASLFPKEIKNKLMEEAAASASNGGGLANSTRASLLNGMTAGGGAGENGDDNNIGGHSKSSKIKATITKSKPIADLFPETTIFFADIAGFTAWSSAREPCQVFTLLENIYHAFDEIAEARRVFKVETVGDCYVAVTGLPVPRKDHAVVMCRFARDCLNTFNAAVKDMESSLGPDTADLGLRVGLHSGPVTAGVLRGERSRFQLFGDTVNTASRMETNGLRDRIHVSQETADILMEAGKSHWVNPRTDKIVAKGKGELQTYWVEIKSSAAAERASVSGNSVSGAANDQDDDDAASTTKQPVEKAPLVRPVVAAFDNDRQQRLIDWNTDCLLRFLKEIEARRKMGEDEGVADSRLRELEQGQLSSPLDEVCEIIVLPTWEDNVDVKDLDAIDLGDKVKTQLREFISIIANMYRKNPFHNFEHASHVSMSVIKLSARIVAPPDLGDGDHKMLHDHTYGITSDPMIQFACAFSSLIHDVDHSGVPNMQLIKEKSKLAKVYKDKSVAEQNSVDLSWALLMDDSFSDMRRAIYHNETEFKRFRQLVVNSVMATDIMDKDLKTLRNNRWDKAFKGEIQGEDMYTATNRKATIVIEHLIQASDVAHTMQHWHIYRKWNERFFTEMYKAYKQGRSDTNPADNWYQGEMGFFDFYIIPLAKKLKDCGVFGVSSDEYLNYAQKNRKEWEGKGQEVVEQMMERVKLLDFELASDNTSTTSGSSSSADSSTGAQSQQVERMEI